MFTDEDFDRGIFENSGQNLAEYLMSKRPNGPPKKKLFNLKTRQDDEEVSIRFTKKTNSNPVAPRKSTSSSTSTVNSSRFLPGAFSTPYPNHARGVIERGRNTEAQSFKSAQTQTGYHATTPKQVNKSAKRVSFNLNNSQHPDSERTNGQSACNVSIRGNVPELDPIQGSTPQAHQQMGVAAHPNSPDHPPEEHDPLEKELDTMFNGNPTNLAIRSVDAINSAIREVIEGCDVSRSTKRTPNNSKNPVNVSLLTDDESEDEGDPETQQNCTTSHRKTIQEPEGMDISSQTPAATDSRQKTAQRTENNVQTILEDWSDDEATIIAEENPATGSPEEPPNHEEVPPPPQRLTFSNRTAASIVPPSHQDVPPPPQRLTISNKTAPSIAPPLSNLFKPPPPLMITKITKRRTKKIDSPLQRQMDLEKTVQTSFPRSSGNSKRKLFSRSTQNYEEEPPDGGTSSSPSSRESFQPETVEEIVEDIVPQESVALPQCSVVVECLHDAEIAQLVTKSKSARKRKHQREEAPEEIPEEGGEPLRRSSRQRRVPRPVWMQYKAGPQLVVRTYNENLSLRQRYAAVDMDETPDLRGDFTMLMEKKAKQKSTRAKKEAENKRRKLHEGVEPQVGAAGKRSTAKLPKSREVQEPIAGPSSAPEPCGSRSAEKEEIEKWIPHLYNYRSRHGGYLEESTGWPGVRMFVRADESDLGYLLFDPGAKKRRATVTAARFLMVVHQGTFFARVNEIRRGIKEGDILLIYEGQKYSFINTNPKMSGKIFFYVFKK